MKRTAAKRDCKPIPSKRKDSSENPVSRSAGRMGKAGRIRWKKPGESDQLEFDEEYEYMSKETKGIFNGEDKR